MKKDEWYKKGWGLLLAIVFLPLFAIWYLWAKTNWTKRNKWIGTIFIGILILVALCSPNSNSQTTVNNSRQANKSNKTITSDPKEDQVKTSPGSEVTKSNTSSPSSQASPRRFYNVVKVVDGDTIDVSIDGKTERLRLIGIDTPETVDPRKPVQCFGKESSNKAQEILSGKKVSLESDPTQGDKDKYDRLLRYVFLENGTDFQKLMISEGYAHEYTYNLPYKYQTQYKQAEKDARAAHKGLWSPNTCNGDTTKAAAETTPTTTSTPSTTNTNNQSSGVVKMSTTGICHAPGTTYYNKTTNFTPYNSIDACLAAGGRLPKR